MLVNANILLYAVDEVSPSTVRPENGGRVRSAALAALASRVHR